MSDLSDSERSDVSRGSSRDLDEWVVVNNSQQLSDVESNDGGPSSTKVVYVKEQPSKNDSDAESAEKVEFENNSLTTTLEPADQLPHCSSGKRSRDETETASIVFVNKNGSNEETCVQAVPEANKQRLAFSKLVSSDYIDQRENVAEPGQEKETMTEPPEYSTLVNTNEYADDNDNVDDDAPLIPIENDRFRFALSQIDFTDVGWKLKITRIVFYVVTTLFFIAITVAVWRSAAEKKASRSVNVYDVPSQNVLRSCQADLHDKLRQLATCKSSKDFCESADKPDCTKQDAEKSACRNRLGEVESNIQHYKNQQIQLVNEIKLLQSNLTSMTTSYSNLRAAKFLEATWFRRTNEALLEKLKKMNDELAESRQTDTTLRHLLAQLEYRLHTLKESLEKSRRDKESRDSPPKPAEAEPTGSSGTGTADFSSAPRVKSYADLSDYVRKLFANFKPPSYKVDDFVTFTTSVLNESFANLRKFYETVQKIEESEAIASLKQNLTNDIRQIKSSLIDNFGQKITELWRKSKFLPEEWWNSEEEEVEDSDTTTNTNDMNHNNPLDFSALYNLVNENFGKIFPTISSIIDNENEDDENQQDMVVADQFRDHEDDDVTSPFYYNNNEPIFDDVEETCHVDHPSTTHDIPESITTHDMLVNRKDSSDDKDDSLFDGDWSNDDESLLSANDNKAEEKSGRQDESCDHYSNPSLSDKDSTIFVNTPSEAKLLRAALKSSDFDSMIDERESEQYLYRLKRISKLSSYNAEEYTWWACQKRWWMVVAGKFRTDEIRPSDCSGHFSYWQLYILPWDTTKEQTSTNDNRRRNGKNGFYENSESRRDHVTGLSEQKIHDLIGRSTYFMDVLSNFADQSGYYNKFGRNNPIGRKPTTTQPTKVNGEKRGAAAHSASKTSDWMFDRWRNRQSSRRQEQQGYDQSKWVFERGTERQQRQQHHTEDQGYPQYRHQDQPQPKRHNKKTVYKSKKVFKNKGGGSFWDWDW